MQYLYLGNDHATTVPSVTVGGVAATTGTMTWRLYDATATSIASGSLANDGAGNFSATIESSAFASETANTYGTIKWVFAQGTADAEWTDDVLFLKRPPGV